MKNRLQTLGLMAALLLVSWWFIAGRGLQTARHSPESDSVVSTNNPVNGKPLSVNLVEVEEPWVKVDEGLQFLVPPDWKKQKSQGIDSHVGRYSGPSAYLDFDEVFLLGYTVEQSQKKIDDLKKQEADPKLLKAGEEVWRVNGQIAGFTVAKVDPKIFGEREYPNVASLFVPYAGKPGYLSVHLFYANEKNLPTVRRMLQSFTWPKMSATKS